MVINPFALLSTKLRRRLTPSGQTKTGIFSLILALISLSSLCMLGGSWYSVEKAGPVTATPSRTPTLTVPCEESPIAPIRTSPEIKETLLRPFRDPTSISATLVAFVAVAIGDLLWNRVLSKKRWIILLLSWALVTLIATLFVKYTSSLSFILIDIALIGRVLKDLFVSTLLVVLLFGIWNRVVSRIVDSRLVDINTADKQQLSTLPGVGSALAKRIIDYRPFEKIEDIRKVPGIGDKHISQMKYKIKVGRTVKSR